MEIVKEIATGMVMKIVTKTVTEIVAEIAKKILNRDNETDSDTDSDRDINGGNNLVLLPHSLMPSCHVTKEQQNQPIPNYNKLTNNNNNNNNRMDNSRSGLQESIKQSSNSVLLARDLHSRRETVLFRSGHPVRRRVLRRND